MSHPGDFPMSVPQDFSSLEVHLRRPDDGLKEVGQEPGKYEGFKEVGQEPRKNEGLKEVDQRPGRLLSAFSAFGEKETVDRSASVSPRPEYWNPASQRSTLLQPYNSSLANSWSHLMPDKEVAVTVAPVESNPRSRRICGLPARSFWLLLAAILVVVALAVGVSVGLHVRKSHSAGSPTTNGGSLAVATKPSLASPLASSAVPNAVPRDPSSGLASVAWNDTKGTLQYRVYYQDTQDSIKEYAWNGSSNAWEMTQTLGTAQAKTPIAAVVTGPQDFAFELSVYTLGQNGSIVEWTTRDGTAFASGNMTSQNIQPANDSALTALWDRHHGCPQCSNNLLFAYERSDGQLTVGNFTQRGWQWTTLPSSPAPGTDLDLALRWQSTASGDIRLFYQMKDGNLVSQDFNGFRGPSPYNWVSREAAPLSMLTSISPLATFTWGTTNSGDALYNEVVSGNSTGLAVNWWDGIYDTSPAAYSPQSMASVDAKALAAHADKHIYALQDGFIKEFAMAGDGVSWSYVANLNVG